MGFRPSEWLSRRLRRRGLREWTRIVEDVEDIPAPELRKLRDEARHMRGVLRGFLSATSPAVFRGDATLDAVPVPPGTEWRWRPQVFSALVLPVGHASPQPNTRLGDEMTIWHDCPDAAFIVRQVPLHATALLAPYGLRAEVMGFQGSYMSLSLDLPAEARQGLSHDHILRVETSLRTELEQSIKCRLNITYGPNTDQLVADFSGNVAGETSVCRADFDLSQSEMNTEQLGHIWIDILLPSPWMNRLDFSDLIVSRYPRADL